jgi:hypothetical protein
MVALLSQQATVAVMDPIPGAGAASVEFSDSGVLLSRWNGAGRLGVFYAEHALSELRYSDLGVATWRGETHALRAYLADAATVEVELILLRKPETNVFTFDLQGDDALRFQHQPELRQDEIGRGCRRPEHIINSFAVYHSRLRDHWRGYGNFATGKLWHIHRAKAIDADRRERWCAMRHAPGALQVIAPPDFIREASYPLLIDPTFGYTSVGASNGTLATEFYEAHGPYSPGSNGDAESVSAATSAFGNAMTLGIYSDSSGTPGTNLRDTAEGTTTTGDAFFTINLDSPLSVSSGSSYWLMNAQPGTVAYKYDAGGAVNWKFANISYSAGSLPANWPGTLATVNDTYSIYSTYTASGGGGGFLVQGALLSTGRGLVQRRWRRQPTELLYGRAA